ncbi:MAG: DUF3047 domain-containing protein [Methylococcaceae bacterium]|nr:DUF3047 domain-containing protein [Methylococcaceae bacterium]
MAVLNTAQKYVVALLLITVQVSAADSITLGAFSTGDLKQWEAHVFQGKTDYALVTDAQSQQHVLKASSNDSASGLVKKQRIDLTKTPFITWRWKINNYLTAVQERTKAGDDYAARVYVVVDGGLLFWQTKSINYVWASNIPKQTVWPNAYAGDAVKMLALRSKTDALNTWMPEKRNVREDFKRYMGLDIQFIDAVALMTDTDNSHATATAFYGDITFSEH